VCGIAGAYIQAGCEAEVSAKILRSMVDRIAHRGPDDKRQHLSPDHHLGLGFARLAIVDLSPAGHQPMSNEDGSLWIVLNGEIYNHADHRTSLEARGHSYRSRADTECILHLYEEFGAECLLRLRGMFAFALWDAEKRQLFLARDRVGVKPLYYTHQNGVFVFASEIKAILEYPGIQARLCPEALYHYVTFMAAPAPLTLFDGIFKLPAGHCLTVDDHGEVHETEYWDPLTRPNLQRCSVDEYAEMTLELLRESIRLRMMSDVPQGVFLSGGVDSSAIVSLMAEHSEGVVKTFTVGFRAYASYNELEYARQVSHVFGTDHHEILIDHTDAVESLPELVWSLDEPIADWTCLPQLFVARLMRQSGVVVGHVGEGADELFCGYPGYLQALERTRLWSALSRVPSGIWSAFADVCSLPRRAGLLSRVPGERSLRRLAECDVPFWGGAIAFRLTEKDRLLDTPFWQQYRKLDSAKLVRDVYSRFDEALPGADALEKMIYLELKQRLPELLLMRVDKPTMSTSVEARVPFLDHKLVEFALAVPMEVKLNQGQPKWLLRRALRGLLPSNIIDRPKKGFAVPMEGWLRNELAGQVRLALLEGEVGRRGYLNLESVARLLDQHQSGRSNRAVQLWTLYCLEMWHRQWIS